MHAHERQYIDALLALATERYAERLIHRCGGAYAARARLGSPAVHADTSVETFVRLFFADVLLDSPAGAAVVLQALADRSTPGVSVVGVPIGDALQVLARVAFAAVLAAKTEEALDRALVYEADDTNPDDAAAADAHRPIAGSAAGTVHQISEVAR